MKSFIEYRKNKGAFFLLNPQVIKKILIHLGENAKIPGLAPPRGPPEIEEWLPELNPYQ